MKTEVLKIKGDWNEVLNDCRATVKKLPISKHPSEQFIKSILISEHSPVRDILVKWKWEAIPYWVAMHWKTHHWESRVDSQRNDRQTRYDRTKAPQDAPVDFYGDANVQNLIDTWRKRLCFQASPETRGYAEDLKTTLNKEDILDMKELSNVLVPNCVYRCGCPELNPCGHWNNFIRWCAINKSEDPRLLDIQTRYDYYNEYFEELRDGANQ